MTRRQEETDRGRGPTLDEAEQNDGDGRPTPGTWTYTLGRIMVIYSLTSFGSKLLLHAKKSFLDGNSVAPSAGRGMGGVAPGDTADGVSGGFGDARGATTSAMERSYPQQDVTTDTERLEKNGAWVDEHGIRHFPPLAAHIPPDPVMGLPSSRLDGLPMDTHWCLWPDGTEMELRVFVTDHADWDLARDWPDAWPDNYRLAAEAEAKRTGWPGAEKGSRVGNAMSASERDDRDPTAPWPPLPITHSRQAAQSVRRARECQSHRCGGGGDANRTADGSVSAPAVDAAHSRLVWHVPDLLLVNPKKKHGSAKGSNNGGRAANENNPSWSWSAAVGDRERETRSLELNYSLTDALRFGNGSAFAHVFLTHRGAPLDRLQTEWHRRPALVKVGATNNPAAAFLRPYDTKLVSYRRYEMTKYGAAEAKRKKVVSLLGGDEAADAANAEAAEKQEAEGGPRIVSLWKPTLALHLVQQYTTFRTPQTDGGGSRPGSGIPAPIARHMSFDYATGAYFPILYRSEFWLMAKHLVNLENASSSSLSASSSSSSSSSPPVASPVPGARHKNPHGHGELKGADSAETSTESGGGEQLPVIDGEATVPLSLSFSPISLWKWQLMSQMEEQWREQERSGLAQEGQSDVLRQVLMDTDPVLLVVTGVVSALHMIFEFLAFSNDVSFFRQRRDFTGLSVRSMVLQCAFQTVILLYLFDNDTSWVVLTSSSIGLVIEYWKVSKAMSLEWFQRAADGSRSGFRSMLTFRFLTLKERDGANYEQSRTKEYDKIATDHLMYGVVPLVVGYSCFALTQYKYKSWYSWILSSLVSFIYAFGFVMMTPQLFINYKLKSVAHLPWKAMIYKSLNTFIDDLFAFVIKMPFMHRLACLRDDFIFLIFLYQRWIYPIDLTRINEFGQEFVPQGESATTTTTAICHNGRNCDDEKDTSENEAKSDVVRTSRGDSPETESGEEPKIPVHAKRRSKRSKLGAQ